MRSYRIEQVTVDKKVLESVTCNVCGRVFKNGPHGIEEENEMELYCFTFTGGFHSKIGDGIRIFFDICEDCMIKLLDSFRVPFEAVDLFGGDPEEDLNNTVWHAGNDCPGSGLDLDPLDGSYVHRRVRELARALRA